MIDQSYSIYIYRLLNTSKQLAPVTGHTASKPRIKDKELATNQYNAVRSLGSHNLAKKVFDPIRFLGRPSEPTPSSIVNDT